LRKDMRLGGAYYEVSHDTLIKPIVESYTLRKAEEQRVEAQRKLKRALGFGAVAVLFAVGAFALAAWAWGQRNKAKEAQIEAINEKENVVHEKNRADSLLIISLENERIAKEKEKEAIENLEKFTKQKVLTSKAEQERNQQELKRLISLANGYIANEGYNLALKELKIAQKIAPSNEEVKRLIEICNENL